MNASGTNFSFMLGETLIEIPFFQRVYVWEEEQWEQLFDDLAKSYENEREHFLGSIVLKQLESNAGAGSRRSLIDGQQRLTTFSILIKSLQDVLEPDDRNDYIHYLYKTPTKEKIPKIQHSRLDRIAFNKILSAESVASKSIETDTEDKLIRCYKHFSKRIQEIPNRESFLKWIIDSKLWVTINLDANEDEQKIFDSLNTAGLKLTSTDIIKNAIFTKRDTKLDYEKLYKDYWECVFEQEQSKDFWEQEIPKAKRVQSEIFLHAFAVIHGFFDTNKDTLENLSALYKAKINTLEPQKLENFLTGIKEYATVYKQLPQITKETVLSFDNTEYRLFHILKTTENNTIMPLILALKYNLAKNTSLLEECYKFLEVFILTRFICSKSTNGYNKLFANLAKNIHKNENPLSYLKQAILSNKDSDYLDFPKREEIEESLKMLKKDNKKPKLILFWVELYRRYKNNNRQDIVELSYTYTLEHLIPLSWKENWSNVIKDEQSAEELIYQIGNMTLLKNNLNSIIKDSSWQIKLKGDGSRKGCIEKYTDLSITRELVGIKEWNQKTVQERSKKLIKEFFEIWNVERFCS